MATLTVGGSRPLVKQHIGSQRTRSLAMAAISLGILLTALQLAIPTRVGVGVPTELRPMWIAIPVAIVATLKWWNTTLKPRTYFSNSLRSLLISTSQHVLLLPGEHLSEEV